MDECEKYIDLISARLDGEISESEEAILNMHLENCEACRELSMLMENTRGVMTDLIVEPPAELHERIMSSISSEKNEKKRRFVFGRFTAAAAMLAVILLAVYAFPNIVRNDENAAAPAEEAGVNADSGEAYFSGGAGTTSGSGDAAESDIFADAENESSLFGMSDDSMEDARFEAPLPTSEPGASDTQAAAPALPYSNYFSAILVYQGEMPEELLPYESETGTETEIFVFVPAEDAEALIASGRYQVYLNGPNISADADTAIVIIYGET